MHKFLLRTADQDAGQRAGTHNNVKHVSSGYKVPPLSDLTQEARQEAGDDGLKLYGSHVT